MIPRVSLRQALSDRQLLANSMPGDSYLPMRSLLLAAFGEVLTDAERATFRQLTQRDREPLQRVDELVIVKGRRAGGSLAMGKVVIPYLSGLCRHTLTGGERGVLLVVAQDQRTADGILDYAEDAFRTSPILSQLIETRNQRELRLTNNVTIDVRAADFRRLRGLTFVGVVADECAFWMTSETSANADDDILNAIRPGLASTGGQLFIISSPYARRGELWETHRKHFGPNGDRLILVAQGSSRTFNPTLPQRVVDRAMERDPASASAEYLAEFRTDIESFVALEAVNACISRGMYERPYNDATSYHGFVDPSGGSVDSFTLCIGHLEFVKQSVVIDCIREVRPPFSPEATVEDFCKVLTTSPPLSETSTPVNGHGNSSPSLASPTSQVQHRRVIFIAIYCR